MWWHGGLVSRNLDPTTARTSLEVRYKEGFGGFRESDGYSYTQAFALSPVVVKDLWKY